MADVPVPPTLPERMRQLASELRAPVDLTQIARHHTRAAELLDLAAGIIGQDRAPLATAARHMELTIERLHEFLAGAGFGRRTCDTCFNEMDVDYDR